MTTDHDPLRGSRLVKRGDRYSTSGGEHTFIPAATMIQMLTGSGASIELAVRKIAEAEEPW